MSVGTSADSSTRNTSQYNVFVGMPQVRHAYLLPLPTRYRIYFGEPLSFQGNGDEDDDVIQKQIDQVKGSINSMLHRGLRERDGVFR